MTRTNEGPRFPPRETTRTISPRETLEKTTRDLPKFWAELTKADQMESKKQDVWDLDVIVSETHRVCFDEPVTLEEAKSMYLSGTYEDVTDTRDTDVLEVTGGS